MQHTPESPEEQKPTTEDEYHTSIHGVHDPVRREILEQAESGASLDFEKAEHTPKDIAAEVDNINERKRIVLTLYTEIRPMLYGLFPSFVHANTKETGQGEGDPNPLRTQLEYYMATYRNNPEAMIELLSICIGELTDFDPSVMASDMGRQDTYAWHANVSLATLKDMFQQHFPAEYAKRYKVSKNQGDSVSL